MKIAILGALGYVGSALVDLYRDETAHEVWLLDRRFVPHLLANLPGHHRFVQGDILDRPLVAEVVEGADVVYMMAAEVEAEKSVDRGAEVWKVNYEGAMGVADLCGAGTRLVFPSTGNVFGGVDESVKFRDLTEEDPPQPKLPYAESKVAVEKHLASKPDGNYTICRFGTNYGYAPGIRFNLVTNLFAKRALQGMELKLHGGGENFRPTVHVRDAARAAKFLAGRDDARGEIYHVVHSSHRIRDLAETVARVGPPTRIVRTDDPVPFSSYDLSNAKLRAAGFAFEYDLETGLRELFEVFGRVESPGGD